jgi:hypothetical protein
MMYEAGSLGAMLSYDTPILTGLTSDMTPLLNGLAVEVTLARALDRLIQVPFIVSKTSPSRQIAQLAGPSSGQ